VSLAEIILAILYFTLLATMIWSPQSPTIGDSQRAVAQLDNALLMASQSAGRYPDGATLIATATATSTITVTYTGRPDGEQGYEIDHQTITEPITLSGNVTSYAFAIAPDGSTVLVSPWTSWAAASGGGTTCTTLNATTGKGEIALATTIDCASLHASF
jgi:hypothetical protein